MDVRYGFVLNVEIVRIQRICGPYGKACIVEKRFKDSRAVSRTSSLKFRLLACYLSL